MLNEKEWTTQSAMHESWADMKEHLIHSSRIFKVPRTLPYRRPKPVCATFGRMGLRVQGISFQYKAEASAVLLVQDPRNTLNDGRSLRDRQNLVPDPVLHPLRLSAALDEGVEALSVALQKGIRRSGADFMLCGQPQGPGAFRTCLVEGVVPCKWTLCSPPASVTPIAQT